MHIPNAGLSPESALPARIRDFCLKGFQVALEIQARQKPPRCAVSSLSRSSPFSKHSPMFELDRSNPSPTLGKELLSQGKSGESGVQGFWCLQLVQIFDQNRIHVCLVFSQTTMTPEARKSKFKGHLVASEDPLGADGCLLIIPLCGGKRDRLLCLSLFREHRSHPEALPSLKPGHLPKAPPSRNIFSSELV